MFAEPVELPVAVPALGLKQVLEHFPILVVVWLVEKVQASHVLQVFGELFWMTLTQHFDGRGSLSIAYLLVSLLESVRLEALPGQRAPQKVHEHVAESFEIVATTLLLAQMCVYAHVSSGARQALVFSVGYVFVGLRVYVGFGQAEVDYVYDVLAACRVATDQKVFWLHVTVD